MVVAVLERLGISVPLTGTAMEIVSSDDGTGEKTRGFHIHGLGRQPRLTNIIFYMAIGGILPGGGGVMLIVKVASD